MKIRYTKEENNNVMSRYDHKIETSLEGIEHLSKEKKEEKERKMKEKNHYYNPLINEVLKDKEKIEKGSRIIEKKPRNNLCYTFYGQFSGFYVPDPCELSFANTLLLSNAAISLGNAFISLEISSSSFIFFSLFSFIYCFFGFLEIISAC